MAIVYNLNTSKDTYTLGVSQDTNYVLTYISGKVSKIAEGEVLNGNTVDLPVSSDGDYTLLLSSEGELDLTINLNVKHNLQNSIITDALSLLCDKCNGCNGYNNIDCLSKIGKTALKFKATLIKLITYQSIYIPKYSELYSKIFKQYLKTSLEESNCNIQTIINTILKEECIDGSVKNTDKIFKTLLAIYWMGMYLLEVSVAGEDEEQIEFIKSKYYYNDIVDCVCGLCIDINNLEDNFNENLFDFMITSFQFNGAEFDIDDIALLTPNYLQANGTIEDVATLEAGKNITYTKIGRIGFVLSSTLPDVYSIQDMLGNDITNVVFDKVYDAETNVEILVSKEHYVPSTLYFKFVKN